MTKKEKQDLENTLVKQADFIDYDATNKAIKYADKDMQEISKKTIENIARWALNGADNKEIANNLELSASQFRLLCELCPDVVAVMSKGRELANALVAGSLMQTALGGTFIQEEQLVKVHDYNEDGKVIGEHYEKMVVKKQLPPNATLLKFLAEHKLDETFGDKGSNDHSNEHRQVIEELTDEQYRALEKALNNEQH